MTVERAPRQISDPRLDRSVPLQSQIALITLLRPELRQKQAESLRKRWKEDPEFRQRISLVRQEMWKRPDYRARKIEALKRKPGYFTGRKHSAETRRRMSEAHKGKTLSSETRAKISEANTRRWRQNAEYRRRMSQPLSLEHRRRTAEGVRRKWKEPEYRRRALSGKALWSYLKNSGLLIRIVNHNYLNKSEVEQLDKLFDDFKLGQKIPLESRPLYTRLRTAVARLS